MRIALTGASGYTGGHVLAALRARNHEVTALVRSAADAERIAAGGTRVVRGALTDAGAVRELVLGSEAVIHIAAVYRTAGHPDSYYRDVNVGGTARLLDAACAAGVRRFVHTSTVGVHGDVRTVPADEASPFAPGDIYQVTKAEAETLALQAHRERGLPVVVLRPGAIYGPGETRLLKLFRLIARGRYAVVGDGRPFYHPVFIDDLVAAYLLALERESAIGEALIVAGPRYVSQAELAETIARHTGGRVWPFRIPVTPLRWLAAVCEGICVPLGLEPPLHRRRVEFWTKSRAFSIEKARRVLGFDPRVDLDEGVARTVAAYRQAGWL
jgi:nucleoside-diphosphate-sugar epimerase